MVVADEALCYHPRSRPGLDPPRSRPVASSRAKRRAYSRGSDSLARTPRKWTGARSPSGLKRVRNSERRHEILGPRRTAAKTLVRKALAVAEAPTDGEDPQAALSEAMSALDRAAKVGAIHRNAAARRKSRLAIRMYDLLEGTAVVAKGKTKTVGKAAAQKAAKARIAAGKADKAKGAQTAAGKARAALSKTARTETATAAAATAKSAPTKAVASKSAASKAPAKAATTKTTAAKPAARSATTKTTAAKPAARSATTKKASAKKG
jgi:ribosomal protein S20